MISGRSVRMLLACAGAFILASGTAQAQKSADWPSRPITIIVPGAAGGTTDNPTRLVAQPLAKLLNQSVIVDNKPGSGGIIGIQALMRSPADGHTLLVGNTGSNAINYSAYKKLTYKASDFIPLTDLISFASVLVVNAESPFKTVSDLVEKMRAGGDAPSFASAGIGQTTHLTGELLQARVNGSALHVPYRGSAPATMSLLSGETDFMFDNLTLALPHIQSGKLRALAVTSRERIASLPDVPTMGEAGVDNFVVTGWLGFFAPAGTPADVVETLQDKLRTSLAMPEISQQLTNMGGIPGGRDQKDFADYVEAEEKMWREIIEAQNLVLD